MSVGDYKAVIEELRVEFDKLEAGASARLHALLDRLTGHVPAVEAEVKADAEQVAHDAETAAAPVVAEAEQDAGHVAGEVAADVTAAVETSAGAKP